MICLFSRACRLQVRPTHVVELSGDAKHANFERPLTFENVVAERGWCWLADARSAPLVAPAHTSGHNGHAHALASASDPDPDSSCLIEKHDLQLRPYKHFLVKSAASSTCAPHCIPLFRALSWSSRELHT